MNCYALTEDKNNDVNSDFYEEIENVYDTLPKNTVITEDFIAQVGHEPIYRPIIGRESLHEISKDE